MAMPILIIGESGSGKTASLRNFKKGEIYIFEVAGKELPFKNDFDNFVKQRATYDDIKKITLAAATKNPNAVKTWVIDDSQYLMAFESFARAKETGYSKNVDLARNFKDLIDFVITALPRDWTVYFLHHIAVDENTGVRHAKTLGKMLDNQLTVEGMFTMVLMTNVLQGKYTFITHNLDGLSTVKSPIGMFVDDEIDNDLKIVDHKVRDYYGWDKPAEVKKNADTKEDK